MENTEPNYLLSKEHLLRIEQAYPSHIDLADLLGHIKQTENINEMVDKLVEKLKKEKEALRNALERIAVTFERGEMVRIAYDTLAEIKEEGVI